jgi:Leucine-rich repeat (LRR) protein
MTKQLATLTNLEIIMFSNCSLTHLPDFSNLHKLGALSLPYNNFIQTDELQDLDLQTLDLSGNNLTEIPILKNKEHLLVLYLSNNPLKNAERILFYPNLYLLYMDHAMLTSIPPAIDKLSELEYLFIFGNQLTDLPPNILNLSKLKILIASENLFSPDYIESIKEAFKKHRPTTTLTI